MIGGCGGTQSVSHPLFYKTFTVKANEKNISCMFLSFILILKDDSSDG